LVSAKELWASKLLTNDRSSHHSAELLTELRTHRCAELLTERGDTHLWTKLLTEVWLSELGSTELLTEVWLSDLGSTKLCYSKLLLRHTKLR
jgi:hypothetical protein